MAAPNIPDDIRSYLVNTVGLSNVTLYALAPTPINQYAIVEYPGPQSIRVHGGGTTVGDDVAFDEATIQIQSRHTSIQTARNNLQAIYDAFDGLMNTTINSKVYTYIYPISRVRLLDFQEEGSAIFIFELRVQVRR